MPLFHGPLVSLFFHLDYVNLFRFSRDEVSVVHHHDDTIWDRVNWASWDKPGVCSYGQSQRYQYLHKLPCKNMSLSTFQHKTEHHFKSGINVVRVFIILTPKQSHDRMVPSYSNLLGPGILTYLYYICLTAYYKFLTSSLQFSVSDPYKEPSLHNPYYLVFTVHMSYTTDA